MYLNCWRNSTSVIFEVCLCFTFYIPPQQTRQQIAIQTTVRKIANPCNKLKSPDPPTWVSATPPKRQRSVFYMRRCSIRIFEKGQNINYALGFKWTQTGGGDVRWIQTRESRHIFSPSVTPTAAVAPAFEKINPKLCRHNGKTNVSHGGQRIINS